MHAGDLLGTIGALLVFACFWMKSSVGLRLMALASNVVFIAYAYAAALLPILLLHAALLPLNAARLWELRHYLRRRPDPGTEERLSEWLLPHMQRRSFAAGDVLLRKGLPANEILLIDRGVVTVGDQAQLLGPGQLLGAIGMFSRARKVVRTVVANTDGELHFLDADTARRLYDGNPGLAGYLISLVTERLLDHARLRGPMVGAVESTGVLLRA